MDDVKLIPFDVKAVYEQQSQIPDGIEMIGSPFLWQQGYQGKGMVVAVLDTGCQIDHPDLKNRIIGGYNFTLEGSVTDFSDRNGHGTHVAGTIAADATGGGVLGVAPQAKLLILKVLDSQGSGSFEGIINAIDYAVKWTGPNGEKVRVLNMSLGGSEDLPELHEAVRAAVEHDISVVVAAGNEGDDSEETYEFAFPGAYNEVIEIGAVDHDGKLAYFSNNNIEIDAVAPGVDILSTYPGSRYARLSGTSMASPHVAGALALLIEKSEKEFQRSFSEAEAYSQLIKETISLGFKKSSEGNGLVKLGWRQKSELLTLFVKQNFCG